MASDRMEGLAEDIRAAMATCKRVAAGLASGTGYQPPEADEEGGR
jgi:hypothetical protein